MSSHHFVKEGQEPALLIIDAVSHELAAQILEWAPQVVVFEKAVEEVLQWGIKMDVVIFTTDNHERLSTKIHIQAPIKTIESKTTEALQTALNYLITVQQKSTIIMVNDAMPLFQSLESFLSKLNITLLTSHIKWSAISTGFYKKWLPAGSILLLEGKTAVHIPPDLTRTNDRYEIAKDGMIELKSKGPFWVGEIQY